MLRILIGRLIEFITSRTDEKTDTQVMFWNIIVLPLLPTSLQLNIQKCRPAWVNLYMCITMHPTTVN